MHVSFAECREAARRLRRAEFGAQARGVVRPRGVLGVVRARGPLPVMLSVAAAEGRLVWRGPSSFALLERPAGIPAPHRPGSRVLRLIDRRWDLLIFAVAPLGLLVASVPAALLSGRPLVGVLLAVAAMAYICLLMTAQVVFQLDWFRRTLGRRPDGPDELAAQSLPGLSWSLPLIHHEGRDGDDGGRDLIRAAMARMRDLVRADVAAAGRQLGGEPELASIPVREVLVAAVNGASTATTRKELQSMMGGPFSQDVVLKPPDDRVEGARAPVRASGGFFFEYVLGAGIVVVICAWLVSLWEYNACLAAGCEGRPATFGAAVHWLAWRLFLQDPAGLAAATPQALAVGWLTSAVGIMAIPVAFTSVRLAIRRQEDVKAAAGRYVADAIAATRLLLLTVTDAERDAVLAAVSEQTPERTFEGLQVIYELGRVGRTRVAMAQCSRMGSTGPGGAILTTDAVIRRWKPHYVLMVGICCGLQEDAQRLGDVCLSAAVEDLDQRIESGDRVEWLGDRVTAPAVLLQRLRAAATDWPDAKVHTGLILSSGALVDSEAYRERLRSARSRAIALDMESAGFYAAASNAGVPWLVVKAISDWGHDRDVQYDHEAPARAAGLVAHALGLGVFDDVHPSNQTRPSPAPSI